MSIFSLTSIQKPSFATLARYVDGRRAETQAVINQIKEESKPMTTATVVAQRLGKPTPRPTRLADDRVLDEYARLADEIGIAVPNLEIEKFKAFLRDNDLPIFALSEVVAYMDDKAKKESAEKAGWEWRPLRLVDQRTDMTFGRPAERSHDQYGYRTGEVAIPASDYYRGPITPTDEIRFPSPNGGGWIDYNVSQERLMAEMNARQNWMHQWREHKNGMVFQQVYDRTVPIHALRKVALIAKSFSEKVAFFVSDYAPAPAIEYPDPFLMAVINNPRVGKGEGRFVIDFWDEPGFGLDSMMK